MAFLNRQVKSVLLLVAAEFDTNVSNDKRVIEIIKAIKSASDYEEERAKYVLDIILDEVKLERERADRERERADRERERADRERERADRERERERAYRERERAYKERERERQFQLEVLKIQYRSRNSSFAKAAEKPSDICQGFYSLGNETAKLIEKQQNKISPVNVITRSQTPVSIEIPKSISDDKMKKVQCSAEKSDLEREEKVLHEDKKQGIQNLSIAADETIIPKFDDMKKCPLTRVTPQDFIGEQNHCRNLKELGEKSSKVYEKDIKIENDRLLGESVLKKNQNVIQLRVPKLYGNESLSRVHDKKNCLSLKEFGEKISRVDEREFKIENDRLIGESELTENQKAIQLCVPKGYKNEMLNLGSKEVTHAVHQIFWKNGFWPAIQCNLGTFFTSELIIEFLKTYEVKISHSSFCDPQSNPVEPQQAIVKRILKALYLEARSDKGESLLRAIFAVRTVKNERTGISPPELILGENLRIPHTIEYGNWKQVGESGQNVVDGRSELNESLKRGKCLAIDRMTETHQKRKWGNNKKAVSETFQVRDQALVLATKKPQKMIFQGLGPGIVKGVDSHADCSVKLPEKRRIDTIFDGNLRKFYHKRGEQVSLVIHVGNEGIEDDACIPYPNDDPNHFEFREMREKAIDSEGIG